MSTWSYCLIDTFNRPWWIIQGTREAKRRQDVDSELYLTPTWEQIAFINLGWGTKGHYTLVIQLHMMEHKANDVYQSYPK